MKKILITGANSYIGTSFEKYMSQFKQYQVETIDMIDGSWREYSFSDYDAVYHVAGLAHADVGKVSEERKQLYYKINTELTIETAKKAKKDGVRQFVFMSSAIVYGESAPIGKQKVITKNTEVSPANFYGDSKVQAERGLAELEDTSFKVVILRPPMIYGPNGKGNYPILSKLAKKLPVFPSVYNERSMLYIENLCEFVRLMIENEETGIFFPQNVEYTQTSTMVREIAACADKKIVTLAVLNPFVKICGRIPGKIGGLVNKAFGNLVYDKELSAYSEEYQLYDLKTSICKTEGKA